KDSINYTELFIPEFKETLKSVHRAGDKLLGLYFGNSGYMLCVFDMKGEMLRGLKFPKGESINNLYTVSESEVGFIQKTSYTPPVGRTIGLNTDEVKLAEETKVHYDADIVTTEIVNYKPKDGTEVPMYLT